MIDPPFPLPGESLVETHGRAIDTIIQELNNSGAAVDSLGQTFLKKVSTQVISIAPGDYIPQVGQWYNQFINKSFTVGIPYDPIAIVTATIKGNNYVLPYTEFDNAGSIVGYVGFNPYSNQSYLTSGWFNQTPAITAYFTIYSQAATANN